MGKLTQAQVVYFLTAKLLNASCDSFYNNLFSVLLQDHCLYCLGYALVFGYTQCIFFFPCLSSKCLEIFFFYGVIDVMMQDL